MTIKAKPILKDKFWIIENNGNNVGTLSACDEQFMYTCDTGSKMYTSTSQLYKDLGGKISWAESISDHDVKEKIAYSFPTSTQPYNTIYDVKNKLALFTKSDKSKSLYCAGYYIIQFEKGWVKSFCPKLITVQRYNFRGPFKTEIEMRLELANATKSTT
jgi:hypothetical protein